MYRSFAILSFVALLFLPALESLQVRAEEISETVDRVGKAASKSTAELFILLFTEKSPCDPTGINSAKIINEHHQFDQYIGWLEQYAAASGVDVDTSFLGYRRLEIADAALKRDCLEIANAEYRQVLNSYSSLRYIGLRDRAKVGIDDVRQKRAWLSSRSPFDRRFGP